MRTFVVAAATAALLGVLHATPASASVVSGLDAPEDIVPIDHAATIVASSLNRGGLYLIDTKTQTVQKLEMSAVPEKPSPMYQCSSLRQSGVFVTHGLSLKPTASGLDRLYVVRHGGRNTVEIFQFARE